jgi:orotidine-5'-phosphate decarboxylase
MRDPRSHLIVALDVPDRSAATAAVSRLSGHVGCFKLGLEIFVREGPRLAEEILAAGEKVFLDLKLHDIPNTVAGAVRSACRLGVDMLTLHAAGGEKMMEAARDAAGASAAPPLLLAVTALTSLSPDDSRSIGVCLTIPEWAERLAELACRSGIPGLVASPLELSVLHPKFGSKMQFVTPGIRPAGASTQDQARTAGPREAMLAGADFIVVGRPILQAPDPVRAADRIVAEIAEALQSGTRR